jgi:hypothetical protein
LSPVNTLVRSGQMILFALPHPCVRDVKRRQTTYMVYLVSTMLRLCAVRGGWNIFESMRRSGGSNPGTQLRTGNEYAVLSFQQMEVAWTRQTESIPRWKELTATVHITARPLVNQLHGMLRCLHPCDAHRSELELESTRGREASFDWSFFP